jgi:hypothetical protein
VRTRWCARQRRHVAGVQPVPREQGDEQAQASGRRREVSVGEGRIRHRRVTVAQWYIPGQSAELWISKRKLFHQSVRLM